MSLNAKDIKKITEELSLIIKMGKIEKLHQHNDNDFIITIYKAGNKYYLYFNLHTGMTRLHLINERLKAQEKPSSFVMLTRKHLKNSILTDVKQLNNDRIINLEFSTKTNIYYIVAELMDKSSNLYFLSKNNRILSFIKPEKNIKKGDIYKLPDKPDINIKEMELSINTDNDRMYNEAVEEKYKIKTEKKNETALNRTLNTPIKKEIKKTKKLIANLKDDLKKVGNPDEYTKYGQLLQAYFYMIKKGMNEIELKDFETENNIKIKLDPVLSPQNNVEKYFKKAKKAKSAAKIIPDKIKATEEKQNKLKEILETFKQIDNEDEALITLDNLKKSQPYYYYKYLEKIYNTIINNGAFDKKKKPQKKSDRDSFRHFISSSGKKIYVARSNRENEELTFKFAKGNDEWLHTRNYPGSHILIPLAKNDEIDGKTLEEAGQLALHFSKAKNNKSADIYHTKRKYLTKPKNAPIGKVNISKYNIINVIYNEKILDRIMDRKNKD